MAQNPNITVDASRLEDVLCVACGGKEFVPRVILKYLPGILSPNGAPAIVTLADGVRCVSCDTIISMAEMQQMARDYRDMDKETGLVSPGGSPLPKALGMNASSGGAAPELKLVDVKGPAPKEETE